MFPLLFTFATLYNPYGMLMFRGSLKHHVRHQHPKFIVPPKDDAIILHGSLRQWSAYRLVRQNSTIPTEYLQNTQLHSDPREDPAYSCYEDVDETMVCIPDILLNYDSEDSY